MVSQMPPPPCEATIFSLREILQHAAHDHAAEREAQIERPADARRQAIVLHPLLAEAEMRRMDHHRHVEVLNQLPERPRLVVVGIMPLVAGMDEDALQPELLDGALGLLDEGRPAARQDGGEAVEHALVVLLHLGGVVGPRLHRRQFLVGALALEVMRGVGDDADVDVVLLVRADEILQHHRAAALAPRRAGVAVPGAQIVGGFFGRVDMRMPVQDHAAFRLHEVSARMIALTTRANQTR